MIITQCLNCNFAIQLSITHLIFQLSILFMASSEKGFPKKAVILGLVLLVGGYFGFKKIYFSLTHETTDNAQIETSIVPVLPRIAGYVKTVHVKDYDSVKQGQLLVEFDAD